MALMEQLSWRNKWVISLVSTWGSWPTGKKMCHPLVEVLIVNAMTMYFDLFHNTPFLDRWKRFGLVSCVGLIIMITWLPLVVLTSWDRSNSFIMDVSIYFRFLVALPILMVSPYYIRRKFRNIVNHFITSDIIRDSDHEKFYSYIKSTSTLRDSILAKTIIWVLVYIGVFYLMNYSRSEFSSTWRTTTVNGELTFSLAGQWFIFISQPIYSFIQLYFLYRALLWWRFLFLVSRLDLQLRASHGDDAGGLIFLGGSIRAFNLPVFGFSTSFAAGAMNLVLYRGFELEDLKFTLLIVVGFCLLVFVGPLFLFFRPLLKNKNKAILSYGRLGGHQLETFENKWLNQPKQKLGASLIESSEFSTVTDTISIVNKVYQMRTLPFTHNVVFLFILCILLPFIPVLAITLPWSAIFKQLFKLVM